MDINRDEEIENLKWLLYDKDLEIDERESEIRALQVAMIETMARLMVTRMEDIQVSQKDKRRALDRLKNVVLFEDWDWITIEDSEEENARKANR